MLQTNPVLAARFDKMNAEGRNAFMEYQLPYAVITLMQGAGRLIRRGDDRGVVAFLDSRMMSARYAGFLQRSLPPFWPTDDRKLVLSALERLDATAPPPLDVADPALRGLTGAVKGTARGDAAVWGAVDATDARPVATAPAPAPSSRTAVTQGHAWTEQEDEELRDGVELGLNVEELSESLELPMEAIAARLEGLGIEAGTGATLSFD